MGTANLLCTIRMPPDLPDEAREEFEQEMVFEGWQQVPGPRQAWMQRKRHDWLWCRQDWLDLVCDEVEVICEEIGLEEDSFQLEIMVIQEDPIEGDFP